jgi:hydrogenase expression/formation protein HypC
MCLGIPGKLLEIRADADPPMGRAAFGAIEKEVCLAYVPEARVGDYVLVHVGFAIGIIDEAEADETMRLMEEIESHALADSS